MPHILIVEDETIIRSALRRLLERNQYQVSEAGSVQEAQERFSIPTFDLIVSDLRLPGAPGTELIKLGQGTPVLIMTSYASLRSAVDSMKMGAVDYIAKPFDHDEMLQAVARILRDRQTATGNPTEPTNGKAPRKALPATITAKSASSAPALPCRICTSRSARWRPPTPTC
ncbi:Transcriptional regulatory protein SrrA [Pseudomonas mediterranea]|nr:Transcriptional regulatory protein SrrA [Pseudomonas mediterranea]